MNKVLGFIIALLLIIVGIFAWLLFAPKINNTNTVSRQPVVPPPAQAAPAPLHERVSVTSPKSGATVAASFDVTGEAPGSWYFEAVFPIEVVAPAGVDNDQLVIARAQGQAQSDWMTNNLVPFAATVTIDTPYHGYHGPATLVLLRDNPSGLPENDDSLEVQITIQ